MCFSHPVNRSSCMICIIPIETRAERDHFSGVTTHKTQEVKYRIISDTPQKPEIEIIIATLLI